MKSLIFVISTALIGCPGPDNLGAVCESNAQCDISWGEYCAKPDCDLEGVCETKPSQLECSYGSPYLVCGCNDIEYSSACWAAEDRQSVKNYGPCEDQG